MYKKEQKRHVLQVDALCIDGYTKISFLRLEWRGQHFSKWGKRYFDFLQGDKLCKVCSLQQVRYGLL